MDTESVAPNPRGRLIAISDVHGCAHAVEALLEEIQPTRDDRLIFLGDLIDQGRDSCAVIELLLELRERLDVVVIRGNHEEMLFAARESESLLRYWENCGGVSTLNSYRFGGDLTAIPAHHWEFLAAGVRFHETEEFIFTHANYQHDLPMDEQPDYQLRWGLFKPEEMQPHESGKTVIVGHTEQANSEILDIGFAICIDTACWRYGWLTALDVRSRQYWQASRWGVLREAEEPAHRGRLPQLERTVA